MTFSNPSAETRLLPAELPFSLSAAMLRGAKGQCPRCGGPGLFARFLKPVERCRTCGQDWTLHQADDFPPYVSILVTGHLLAPVMIAMGFVASIPMWGKVVIMMTLAVAMMLAMLQPAKGGIIAMQWWLGLHDFHPGGREEAGRGGG